MVGLFPWSCFSTTHIILAMVYGSRYCIAKVDGGVMSEHNPFLSGKGCVGVWTA